MDRGCEIAQANHVWWSTPRCNQASLTLERHRVQASDREAAQAAVPKLNLVTSTQTWSKPSPPMAVRMGDPAVPLGSPSSQMRDCRWRGSTHHTLVSSPSPHSLRMSPRLELTV